jgi:hypothetical protein
MSGPATEKYLAEMKRELRNRMVPASRFLEETRGHLADAVAAGERQGLSAEDAEREALARYGDARKLALQYAMEKYRPLHWTLLAPAMIAGLSIAWMDSRPHWDDAGITAGALVLSAALLGLGGPKRPWLLALAIGMWIPLHLIAGQVRSHTVTAGSASYLLILAFPMVGAYAGALVRRMIFARA